EQGGQEEDELRDGDGRQRPHGRFPGCVGAGTRAECNLKMVGMPGVQNENTPPPGGVSLSMHRGAGALSSGRHGYGAVAAAWRAPSPWNCKALLPTGGVSPRITLARAGGAGAGERNRRGAAGSRPRARGPGRCCLDGARWELSVQTKTAPGTARGGVVSAVR